MNARTQHAGTATPGGHSLAAMGLVVGALLLTNTWFAGHNQMMVTDVGAGLLAVFALVACVIWATRAGGHGKLGRLMWAWFAFLGVATASALLSGRGWSAFMGEPTNLLGLLALCCLTLVGAAGRAWSSSVLAALTRWSWLVLLVQSGLAIAQRVSGGSASGTLANSTYFGQLVLLLLPFALLSITWSNGWRSHAALLASVLSIGALAVSGARVALAVAVVMAIAVTITSLRVSRARRFEIALGIVVAVMGLGLAFAGSEFLGTMRSSTLGVRPGMYTMSLHALGARPFLGWGPDGYLAGGASISTPELAERTRLLWMHLGGVDPHNLLLWVAVSTGMVGLGVFLWFCAEVAGEWRRRVPHAWQRRAAVWGVLGTLVVCLTAPVPLQVLPLFTLLLGGSLGEPESAEGSGTGRGGRRVAGALLIAGALLFAGSSFTRAAFEEPSGLTSSSTAPAAQGAADLWRLDPHLHLLASKHWGLSAQAGNEGVARAALSAADRSLALDSRSPLPATEAVYITHYLALSEADFAREFAEAVRRYPLNPSARSIAAIRLAGAGDLAAARNELSIAMRVDDVGPDLQSEYDAAGAAIREAENK